MAAESDTAAKAAASAQAAKSPAKRKRQDAAECGGDADAGEWKGASGGDDRVDNDAAVAKGAAAAASSSSSPAKKARTSPLPAIFRARSDYDAVLLDIEGTTTPIAFVHDVLFPYVRSNLLTYLEENADSEETKDDIAALVKQAAEDKAVAGEAASALLDIPDGEDVEPERRIFGVREYVLSLMDADRKVTALKALQGHMWRAAYESGKIAGQLYDDVERALRLWAKLQLPVFIYSSGSVAAQKLLFGYSTAGDMLAYFKGHFDTKVGSKLEAASYTNIADRMTFPPERILFVTDNIKEARAASEAKMSVATAVRPGNGPLTETERAEFPVCESLLQLVSPDS